MTSYISVTATVTVEATFDVEVPDDFDLESSRAEAEDMALDFIEGNFEPPGEHNIDFDFDLGDWKIQEIS